MGNCCNLFIQMGKKNKMVLAGFEQWPIAGVVINGTARISSFHFDFLKILSSIAVNLCIRTVFKGTNIVNHLCSMSSSAVQRRMALFTSTANGHRRVGLTCVVLLQKRVCAGE